MFSVYLKKAVIKNLVLAESGCFKGVRIFSFLIVSRQECAAILWAKQLTNLDNSIRIIQLQFANKIPSSVDNEI
jgi:hypothetical protein